MAITIVNLTDTFDVWRTRTNSVINAVNEMDSNVIRVKSNTASIVLSPGNIPRGANLYLDLVASTDTSDTSSTNIAAPVLANTAREIARLGFTQANTACTTSVAAFTQANTANSNAANASNIAVASFIQANIGATTAVAAFGKANNGTSLTLESTAASRYLTFSGSTTGVLYANVGYGLTFNPSTNAFGVGTSSPSSIVHARADNNTNQIIMIQNINTGAAAQAVFVACANGTNSNYGMSMGQSYNSKDGFLYLAEPANLTFSTASTQRMVIDKNGYVGIGTTSPTSNLMIVGTTVAGTGAVSALEIRQGGAGENGGQIRMLNTYSGATLASKCLRVNNSGAFEIVNNAYNGVPLSLTDAGALTCLGNITAYSDINMKEDISTIENALDKVSQMRGVMFTRKDTSERGTGVIAQEIRDILPEVVMENKEYLSVAYGNIVGVLIEAIKELQKRVEELEAK